MSAVTAGPGSGIGAGAAADSFFDPRRGRAAVPAAPRLA